MANELVSDQDKKILIYEAEVDRKEATAFLSLIFPDDTVVSQLVGHIVQKNPLAILFEAIVIQYTAICRAQTLMFVKDADDHHTKVLNQGMTHHDPAYERHGRFLLAQSTAMEKLTNMIMRYEALKRLNFDDDERAAKIQQIRLNVEKMQRESDGDTSSVIIIDDIPEDCDD